MGVYKDCGRCAQAPGAGGTSFRPSTTTEANSPNSSRTFVHRRFVVVLFILATQLVALPALENAILHVKQVTMKQLSYVVWELLGDYHKRVADTRVLLMSGHAQDSNSLAAALKSGLPFLPKPFGPETLITRIRELLDNDSLSH